MPFDWWDQTVTVSRAPMAVDSGRTERDWSQASAHDVAGCILVRPSASTDWADPARTRSIDKLLLAPAGSDIAEGDRILHGGRIYEIDGVPEERTSPTGAVDHLRAALVAWSG